MAVARAVTEGGGEENREAGNGKDMGGTGGSQNDKRGRIPLHQEEERGGGLLPNRAPTQTTPGIGQGGGDRKTRREMILPRRTRAAAKACLTATEGGTTTHTGQHVANNNIRLAGERWGAGPPGAGGSQGRKDTERVRCTGHLIGGRVPGSARWGGGPPTDPVQQGYVCAGGGTAPSTEEGEYLQVFTPAKAHLSLQ